MKRKRKSWSQYWIFLLGISALGSVVFAFYLWHLFGQVEATFAKPTEFIPTRIYSDVTRIFPPLPRAFIEERLKALSYSPQREGATLKFKMHEAQYPEYLVPEGDQSRKAGDAVVTLTFEDEKDPKSSLQTIQIGDQEVRELYLEPEMISALSSGAREVREVVPFENIPSELWKAIISIEDQHFMEHTGFDPRGLARAILVNLKTLSLAQGGSTITQQLIKNLTARRGKNIFRKVNELFLALILEARYGKEQILERYLNEVYLGQIGSLEIHGVAEGAKHFFGKPLEELNLAEMALMAGLIRGPGFYSPYRHKDRAVERQRLVLQKMLETGQIAKGEYAEALKEPIRLAPPQNMGTRAHYFFVDYVKAELLRQLKDRMTEEEISAAGFRVYTTLDASLNRYAQQMLARRVDELEKRHMVHAELRLEGALASVEPSSGFIRALIGGSHYSESSFNRILNMKRQVGSTFKPVVALAALLKEKNPQGISYGGGYPVEDAPWELTYDRGRQAWSPKNYEKGFLGWTSLRNALAHSVNTCFARLGVEVGLRSIVDTARALGIESPLPEVPALALGVAELSPIELMQAYSTLANQGIRQDMTVVRGMTLDDGTLFARFIPRSETAVSVGAVDLLNDFLQTVMTEGTAAASVGMGWDRPSAGKTGTTSDYRDSWFAGYTPQYATVVWVGFDQGVPSPEASDTAAEELAKPKKKKSPLPKLTGATAALPIWVDFMKHAHEGEPPTPFPQSSFIMEMRIDKHTGKRASIFCSEDNTVLEKYLSGSEPTDSSCESEWPPSQRKLEI